MLTGVCAAKGRLSIVVSVSAAAAVPETSTAPAAPANSRLLRVIEALRCLCCPQDRRSRLSTQYARGATACSPFAIGAPTLPQQSVNATSRGMKVRDADILFLPDGSHNPHDHW